jgi:hypothetical protein
MPSVTTEQIAPALIQLTAKDVKQLFEQEAKLYGLIRQSTNSDFVNGKGFRIPNYMNPPTGHGYFPEGGSFNVPGPFKFKDMFVWPIGYALPMQFTGRMIRNFQDTSAMVRWMGGVLKIYTQTATKEIEEQLPGDGTGAKAYVLSTVSPGPPVTITCTTTPTASAGRTKGSLYLQEGGSYNVIDPTTDNVRGTFKVLATGPTTVSIDALPAGTIAGDAICHVNSWKQAFRGLAHLISNGTDILQTLSRADNPALKSPIIDLGGAQLSPATFSKLKALLMYRAGSEEGAAGLAAVLPFGQWEILRRQSYTMYRWMKNDDPKGVAERYTDGDTQFVPNTNMDEDRCYLLDLSDIERYVEMDLGLYNLDGLTIRQAPGTNSVGSDVYYAALGIQFNLGISAPMKHAAAKNAAIDTAATQVQAYQ